MERLFKELASTHSSCDIPGTKAGVGCQGCPSCHCHWRDSYWCHQLDVTHGCDTEPGGLRDRSSMSRDKNPPNQGCPQGLASLVLWETGPWEVR